MNGRYSRGLNISITVIDRKAGSEENSLAMGLLASFVFEECGNGVGFS